MPKKKKPKSSNTIPAPVATYNNMKYKVEQAARTLVEADEIRASPGFMKKVNAELVRKEKAIKKARTRK